MDASERVAEIRRRLDAAPEMVFAAFADPSVVSRWLKPAPDIRLEVLSFEFRVGGAYRFAYLTDPVSELLREGVVAPRLDVEAVSADADLAVIAVLQNNRAFDSGVKIGIVEDDEGAWPPSSSPCLSTWSAPFRIRILPTLVEPVNVGLRIFGFRRIPGRRRRHRSRAGR